MMFKDHICQRLMTVHVKCIIIKYCGVVLLLRLLFHFKSQSYEKDTTSVPNIQMENKILELRLMGWTQTTQIEASNKAQAAFFQSF